MSFPFLLPIYLTLPKFMLYNRVKLNIGEELHTILKYQINMKTKCTFSKLGLLYLGIQHHL